MAISAYMVWHRPGLWSNAHYLQSQPARILLILLPGFLKQKLVLIQEIRRFAIDSLGINDSKNYTTVYDQQGKPVLWVVTACELMLWKPQNGNFHFWVVSPIKAFSCMKKRSVKKNN
jgi:predicted aminopeptidase